MSNPHIVLIMTDQQRAGFTAGSGFPVDTMPQLDRVAAEGTRFEHAYTAMPACVPARTSLLTGRYPSAHRVRQNSTPKAAVYDTDLLDLLSGCGYQTFFSGKPHMYRGEQDVDGWAGPYFHTSAPDTTDEQREFSAWMSSIDHGPAEEATPFPLELQYPHRIVDDALEMLAGRAPDQSTFCWVSFPEPHNPYQAPEPYFSMFEGQVPPREHGPEVAEALGGDYAWMRRLVEEKRPGYDDLVERYRTTYCGMLRLLDDQIERLLAGVREHLGEDTVIIFVSDHGDYVGEYGLQRKGAGLPELLMRIPFSITGPGIEARVDDRAMISLVDVLPTIAEMIGQPIPAGVQGRSLWPVLTGAEPELPAAFESVYAEGGFGGLPYGEDERPELHFPYDGTTYDELNSVTQSGTSRMLRRGQWKLIYHVTGAGELYDLDADPYELDNLFDVERVHETRSALLEEMLRWTLTISDGLPQGNYRPVIPEHNWY